MNEAKSAELMDLLNKALVRELQVSVQYMMQHALWAGQVHCQSCAVFPVGRNVKESSNH
jgi:hypothetical protein